LPDRSSDTAKGGSSSLKLDAGSTAGDVGLYLSCGGGSECVNLNLHDTLQFWAKTGSGSTSTIKVISNSEGDEQGTGETMITQFHSFLFLFFSCSS